MRQQYDATRMMQHRLSMSTRAQMLAEDAWKDPMKRADIEKQGYATPSAYAKKLFRDMVNMYSGFDVGYMGTEMPKLNAMGG